MQSNSSMCAERKLSVWLTAFCALAICLVMPRAYSQAAGTGNIQGTVSDATGAVIANAAITLTDTQTQVEHKTVSSSGGVFSFPNLPVGNYNLSVTASGFKRYTRTNMVLEVGSNIGINVSLSVGTQTQEVQVQANSLALQTQDTSFKQTIDQKEVNELPLNGRQMTSLITLSGGAAPAPNNDMVGSKNFYSSVSISIAGGMGNATDYRLDGGDNNDYMTNVNLPFPFPDAVNQFSVETTAQSAQAGLHPGGEVDVVTVSGTNVFHGDAFEFIRNNLIDASNFFSTSPDQLHQNQFGGTVGGPILRDKLFFFGGYQRLISHESQANTESFIPSAANLLGDFSVTDGPTCTSNGKAIQLLNPQTGAILPNNQIDPSYFAATSLALMKYLPKTNDPCGVVSYPIPNNQTENQFVARIDATLSQKNNLYGRYFLDGYQHPAYFSPTNALVTTASGNLERVQSLTLGDNYVFSPNTVNSVHLTVDRRRDNRSPAGQGVSPVGIGVNMFNVDPNFFRLTLSSKWSLYCGTCAPSHFNVNTFAISDDVNLVRGKHQIVFGGEYARSQFNAANHYEENGAFTFTGVFSQKGPAQKSSGGTGADANLDFLTGALQAFEQSKAQGNSLRAPIPSLYVQDKYQATPRLVLSAGVRWSPEYMPFDYFHRGATFNEGDFIAGHEVFSTVYPNAPAGVFYYGDKGVPPNYTQNSPWQFSPRLGITWDPTGSGQTVFRAGGAIVYDQVNFFTSNRNQQNPPFATAASTVPTNTPLNFSDPWSSGSSPGNPFPQPFTPPSNTPFPKTAQYIFMPKQFHAPYVIQWTASMQRQLGHDWMFELQYIGNKTTDQAWGFPLNPTVYTGGSPTANYASRFRMTLENPTQGPKFTGGGGGTVLINDTANANYNGLIATIQHRLSNFSLLANYTWSHCIDIEDAQGDIAGTTVQDPYNPRGDRANCGFDYRSIFNATAVLNSRFTSLHGWESALLNNWELGPILTIRDGAPFTVTTGFDDAGTDIGNERPNLVRGVPLYTGKKLTSTNAGNRVYVNPDAFTEPAYGTYGNLGRNTLRGPTYVELDSELSRFFPVTERTKLDFRIEAFNVLNHPNFNSPSSGNLQITKQTSFGQITGAQGARIFQGAVKFIF
jgi:hypothetical protein